MIKNQKGFTLIELLIVIVILGVLMGTLLPKIKQAKKESIIEESIIKDRVQEDIVW